MARAKRATSQRTIVRLERSAHVLARFHEELRALAPSSRATRLLERNAKEQARIADTLGELRGQPADARALDVPQ